jgi:hypothetical protein
VLDAERPYLEVHAQTSLRLLDDGRAKLIAVQAARLRDDAATASKRESFVNSARQSNAKRADIPNAADEHH